MLFMSTIAEYHHIVIKKIAEAQGIQLVNIDDDTILPYYQELRNSPRDITRCKIQDLAIRHVQEMKSKQSTSYDLCTLCIYQESRILCQMDRCTLLRH